MRAGRWCLLVTPAVVPSLCVSQREHQLPDDGGVERTEDPLVEVDDSPKGRPQPCAHQPEGRGQLRAAFSVAALQHGLEGGLHPLSCVCVCVLGGQRGGEEEVMLEKEVSSQQQQWCTATSEKKCMWKINEREPV